jgi:hypothetical protein
VNYLANELLTIAGLPREHYAYADERLKICKDCEHRGFVSLNEYVVWGIENREALIEHFDDLTKVGDFPARKEPYGSSEHQVCTILLRFRDNWTFMRPSESVWPPPVNARFK